MIEDNSKDSKDKKEDRRRHIKNKELDKKDIFLENNRINISKKEFKQKKLEIEEEELWDDWEIGHK